MQMSCFCGVSEKSQLTQSSLKALNLLLFWVRAYHGNSYPRCHLISLKYYNTP